MSQLAPTEIMALARLLDELDYYQILHLSRGATASECRAAFHATSRAFHPDANRHLDPEQRTAIECIAKRVTEAYTVLRNPRRRRAYDEGLDGGEVRMQIVEAEARAERRATDELQGRTPNGRRYSALARADLERDDLRSAIRNLQTALTFESDNTHLSQKLEEIKQRLKQH